MPSIAELLQLALQYHQGGNLAQAETLYRQVLQADPRNLNALHFLGILANQSGRHDLGIPLIRQAIALNPAVPDFHANLGLGLFEYGNKLFGQSQFVQAAECFREALAINPSQAEVHNNLGTALKELGGLAEAAACFQHALSLNPSYADALFNLGNVFFDQEHWTQAAECYRHALRINPNNADAHNNLGNTFKEQGLLAEAAECYRQALRINPIAINMHVNLGHVLKDLGHLSEAAKSYRQALRSDPHHADARSSLGVALVGQGQLAEAAACFEQALGQYPNHWYALWNRSLLRLLQEDFASGWRDYEQRWAKPGLPVCSFLQPRWDGAPLAGKSILVYAEQGLGDTIQFARYLPLVQERGGKVFFECQPALQGLFAGMPGSDHLALEGEPLPPFDVQVPLLSLPGIFETTLANIPNKVPYLAPDSKWVQHWGQEIRQGTNSDHSPLASRPAPLIIGIVWQGNPQVGNDRLRSIPLRYFETLASVPGAKLVSLQKGPAAEQLRGLEGRLPILDLSDRLTTFADTAAVMKNLDLIVTSDTAVAHLAGALGVPVWTVLALVPDWRWFLGREDSPWYPTMRLFRQQRFGDWGEVFERIVKALRQLLATQSREVGDMLGAEAHYRNILQNDPGNADARNNLGNALFKQNRLAEAAECYRQTSLQNPHYANAHFNLGNVLYAQGRLKEAAECFRQTLVLKPQFTDALNNLGNALKYQGLFAEAAQCFEQALSVDPGQKPALWNRAILRLLQGDFAGGWPDYEQRWALPGATQRPFPQPRWDGSPLTGKTILVHAEQGFGDTFQFLRYLPMVQRLGGHIVFECQPDLADLVAGMTGVNRYVRTGDVLPPFDVHVPLLSLPGIFGTTLATIPTPIPYLQADPSRIAYWRQQLKPVVVGSPLNVGISWQGNPLFRGDMLRSVPLAHFKRLANIPGVRLMSLQKGSGSEQIPAFTKDFPILDLSQQLTSFSDTAAVMVNLDLIVTSDTSIAHLAGALGLPVWTVLQFVPDWRWLLDRPDSPWYPTMRLFRQTRFGDWNEVFERIADEIRRLFV